VAQTSGTGVFSGTVSGAGAWRKAGAGALDLGAGARIGTALVSVDEGALLVTRGGAFEGVDEFLVNTGGKLAGTGTAAAALFTNRGNILGAKVAQSSANYGRLTLDGDYHGAGGTVTLAVLFQDNVALAADQLVITGSATGATRLALVATEVINTTGTGVPLILTGGSADDAFALDKRYANHRGRDLAIYNRDGEWWLDWAVISPEVPAIIGADAVALLAGKASLAALGGRLQTLRMGDSADPRQGGLWLNGFQRRNRVDDTLYKGARADIWGAQAGGDIVVSAGKRTLTFGAFCDFAKTDMSLPDAVSSTGMTSNGAGVYMDYKAGSFYLNALARAGRDDYEVTVPGAPRIDMDGNSWAAALTLGWLIEGRKECNVEPQVQLAWQTHSINDAVDAFDRQFSLDSADSLEGRAGLLVWWDFIRGRTLRFRPFVRGSVVMEFEGRTALRVGERYSDAPAAVFANDFGGGYGVVDAGFSLALGRGVSLYGEGSWYVGGKIGGHTFNLGLGKAW
jgi:outer membrane autotransporter protein